MKCGYPRCADRQANTSPHQTDSDRFFIHPSIDKLAHNIVELYGDVKTEKAMLFPTHRCAIRATDFVLAQGSKVDPSTLRIIDLVCPPDKASSDTLRIQPKLSAFIYPAEHWPITKLFWQHTGEGVQSRRAEFCQKALDDGLLVDAKTVAQAQVRPCKGPRRYQRVRSIDGIHHNAVQSIAPETNGHAEPTNDGALFVEERFGRNLDVGFAAQAKQAVRRRIAGSLTSSQELPDSLHQPTDTKRERSQDVPGFSIDDVYLFPCGMNAIYTSHRLLRVAREELKSVMYGFPYVDTLKILEKFGAGAVFYGHCSAAELDDLERRLQGGERILSLYCEFPGNPLLLTPDLARIRQLADRYDFAVVVDETIGNFLNIHVLPQVDILVSSLTKIFSGDSNVMGGSMILNPSSRYYDRLREVIEHEYEDNLFEEDSVYLERNSRDFVTRIQRINQNAEAIADLLQAHPRVKKVSYPKYGETKKLYDAFKLPDGGYGGLLSATFHTLEDAEIFYDNLDCSKGPSLGTNFTLASPFVILAHFTELEWAAEYGCEASLVRFSVGLDDTNELLARFQQALTALSRTGVSNAA